MSAQPGPPRPPRPVRSGCPDLAADTAADGSDVLVRDVARDRIENLSGVPAPGSDPSESWGAALSADGRQVAFVTTQPNLVPGDPHDQADAFVRDSEGNDLSYRVSDPQLSADGRFVVFHASGASKEAVWHSQDVFVRDLKFGTTRELSTGAAGLVEGSANTDAVISANGRHVVFANESRADTDGALLTSSLWSSDLGAAPTTSSSGLVNKYRPRIATSQKKVRTRGHRLKVVAPGEWEPVLGMRLQCQWLRNGRVIKGATKKTYTVGKRDIRARISVRESAVVPGLKTAKLRSVSLKVSKSDTYFIPRALRRDENPNKPLTLRLRVRHYDGNAPQGKVKVIIGKRVLKTIKVDKDGRMRVKVRGITPGFHVVKVRHTSTAFVNSGGTVELPVNVRS